MNLPTASGLGIYCRFGFSRTGTAEAEPTIELRSKLRGINQNFLNPDFLE